MSNLGKVGWTSELFRKLFGSLEKDVQQVIRDVDQIQHDLSSSMFHVALMVGVAVMVLMLGSMLIRSIGYYRSSRTKEDQHAS